MKPVKNFPTAPSSFKVLSSSRRKASVASRDTGGGDLGVISGPLQLINFGNTQTWLLLTTDYQNVGEFNFRATAFANQARTV